MISFLVGGLLWFTVYQTRASNGDSAHLTKPCYWLVNAVLDTHLSFSGKCWASYQASRDTLCQDGGEPAAQVQQGSGVQHWERVQCAAAAHLP